jgi:prepilin-type N-terminal cleavage/methylation domain-containing protein
MNKWLRGELGFTLLELMIALGIMSIIGVTIAMTTATITKVTPKITSETVALYQAQNAGYWITRDVQTAQIVDPAPITGEFLILTLKVEGSDDVSITYQLQNAADGSKKLMRIRDGISMLVAEHIYYDPVGDPDSSTIVLAPDPLYPDKVAFRITTKCSDTTVIKKYEATQRVARSG